METTEPLVLERPKPNPEWLALVREDSLDPSLPIIDPHHHLWDRPDRSYRLDDLLDDLACGHNIVATVFVECSSEYRKDGPVQMQPVGETEFVVGAAEEAARRSLGTRVCAGIVGHIDLAGERVDEVLEAHIAAGRGRFRGIRHITARHQALAWTGNKPPPPPGLMADPTFRAGFARLAKHRLSFDAWLYHHQLGELLDLAGEFPETPIVIDHVGGPLGVGPYKGRLDEVYGAWLTAMRKLSQRPNVHVKLGGLGMVSGGFTFHQRPAPPSSTDLARTWAPWIDACIQMFGADRCMFESNFPVDKAMYSSGVMWNAFKRLTMGASSDERRALFHNTAARFYRLSP